MFGNITKIIIKMQEMRKVAFHKLSYIWLRLILCSTLPAKQNACIWVTYLWKSSNLLMRASLTKCLKVRTDTVENIMQPNKCFFVELARSPRNWGLAAADIVSGNATHIRTLNYDHRTLLDYCPSMATL